MMPQPQSPGRQAAPAPEQLHVFSADEYPLASSWYSPVDAPSAVVLMASALGVPRRLYFAFCEYLASKGLVGVAFDYRGIGESLPPPGLEGKIDFESWGRLDIDAMIRAAVSRHPDVPIYLVGHSCGGQLVGLAPSCELLKGVVLVAATLPHTSRYPWSSKLGLWGLWYLGVPLYCNGAGHEVPRHGGVAKLGAPNRVLRQWARWARRRAYLFHPKFKLDTARYSRLALPLLALGFSDDALAPPRAIDALVERFPSAKVERRQIDVARLGLSIGSLGHLGFFRSKSRDALWFMVLEWMSQHRA